MPLQTGLIKITGTVGGICYYKRGDKYFTRRISITSEKSKRYNRSELARKHTERFGRASKIASALYKQVPNEQRGGQMFQDLLKKIKQMIKEEIDEQLIVSRCWEKYLIPNGVTPPTTAKSIEASGTASKEQKDL